MLRSGRHGHTALLLVAMWIVTPIVSVFHVAFEDHVYCAEHGALEDAAKAAPRDHLGSRSGLESGVRAADRGEPSGHHEACAFDDCATRDAVDLDVVHAVEPAPRFDEPGPTSVATLASRSLPLLLVAPKSSPPHAA